MYSCLNNSSIVVLQICENEGGMWRSLGEEYGLVQDFFALFMISRPAVISGY